MSLQVIDRPSPNQSSRPAGTSATLVVVHGTAGTDAGDLDWLTRTESRVSYHYLVQRTGQVYRLVDESRRAWHAGRSEWRGLSNCNDHSIGIGFSNGGNGELYTDAQYENSGVLLREILARWTIDFDGVVGHFHVSPGRKTDPWYTFHFGALLEAAR